MTALVEDVQKQGISSAVVVLYDLEYSNGNFVYFFPDGLDSDLTEVQFRDSSGTPRTYVALPAQAQDFEVSSDGAYSRPKFSIANLQNTFSQAIGGLDYEDLIGRRLTRRTTLKKYLVGESGDSGTGNAPVEFPKTVYVIDRISAKDVTTVEFELAAPFDLAGITLPRRVVVGGNCPWKYTGASRVKYTGSSTYGTMPEKEKVGGCNWRADSKLVDAGGIERTVYMTAEDEYILDGNSVSFTNGTGLSSFTAGTYYTTQELNLPQITAEGIVNNITWVNYWQCLSSTGSAPLDSSTNTWRRVWLYNSYQAGLEFKGFLDKRYNQYVVKDGFLWRVNRTTQAANAHNTVEEGLHWTRGDICGKSLTSCAMRFQAKPDGAAGFSKFKDSRISLPFGGFPGVVQRR